MIKKYKEYLREEIDWKNLFRRNKYYPPIDDSSIDPYGEEIWDEEELNPILRIAKKQEKPYDQIIELDCSLKNLTSLEGIEKLINLRYLYCYRNNLTNLNEMKNLINLKELHCSFNNLTNLNGIENLTNLKYLRCDNNNFSNEYKEYLRNYCKKKKITLII
jgi:hypothetical protein